MPTVSPIKGSVTASMLRLLVWIVCDGTIVDDSKYNPTSCKKRVQFKLSRPEKIARLQHMLVTMKMPYTFKPATMSATNKLQPYYIRIYGDYARHLWGLLEGRKEFPEWMLNLNADELQVLIEELSVTDGSRRWNKVQWTTTSMHDVEIVGCLCAKHCIAFTFRSVEHASGFKHDCKTQYRVTIGAKGQLNDLAA